MSHLSKRNLQYLMRSQSGVNRRRRPKQGRSIVVLLLLLLLWSICMGWGLAQATEPRNIEALAQASVLDATEPAASKIAPSTAIGTVDPVPARYQLGQEIYLENCATCHIGLPPAIMPTETWRQLLQDSQHYGVQIKPLVDPSLRVAWDYIRTYSRPLKAEEETPYRVYQSYYFKALHPQVKLASQVNLASCVSCHPGAGKYDFRSLSAEWQNAP